MADAYLLETGTDRLLLEDGSGAYLLDLIESPVFHTAATAEVAGASGHQITVTKPAGTVEGDFLLAQFRYRNNATTGGPDPVPPAGWTLLGTIAAGTTGTDQGHQSVYYKFAGPSEPANYTFAQTTVLAQNDTGRMAIGIGRFSNVDPTTPVDISAQTTGNPASLLAPSATTTVPNTLVLRLWGWRGANPSTNGTMAPPGGVTELWTFQTSANTGTDRQKILAGSEVKGAAGSTGTSLASGATTVDVRNAFTIALAPASAPVPTLDLATVVVAAHDLTASLATVTRTADLASVTVAAQDLARTIAPITRVADLASVTVAAQDITAVAGAVARTFDLASASVAALNATLTAAPVSGDLEHATAVLTALDASLALTPVTAVATTGVLLVEALDLTDASIELQYARPDADAFTDGYTNELGLTTNLFASLDEAEPSDADFAQSPINPATAVLVEHLGAVPEPPVRTFHVLEYRWVKFETEASVIEATIELRQGYVDEASPGTLIASGPATEGSGELPVSEAEASTITDYGDLFVRYAATRTG